ncbi:biotin-dependent carboxyltransferase family protein [Bailinhaonella thermotolerans]|uniref:Biotin-dependent carboxyltransferase family protein n=1 Tax=Bailinhaonella thermotolerans TaxID=1070861 RepID=A0A3A4B9M4_9ACTN|nr:biotin-dependent carboxyltransferase family protein [Bailinhaonella thermotolerans]RJL34424.1 biotin-dependent carboxyltransferase family protein [Bailinhaonella thermotolerans]
MPAGEGGAARTVEVVRPGPYATVQDLGRPGYAHLGVPRSGAADAEALRLANRLLGNAEDAAGIELTFGGACLRFPSGGWAAVTGAPCGPPAGTPLWVRPGESLAFGAPRAGARTYVAVRGGIAVEPVLGSRSTDSLSGLGPPPLAPGDVLPVGRAAGEITVDVAPVRPIPERPVLRLVPGPREDWFAADALEVLCASPYTVQPASNRVGVRLSGPEVKRARGGELPSEGMVLGAVQVPPSGQPIVFLADHPTTGGYPVIGVVTAAAAGLAAQLRPGQEVRFALA